MDFIRDLEAFCAKTSVSPSTICNRVLGQTYALPRMIAAAEKIDARIARLSEAMATTDWPERKVSFPPPPTDGLCRMLTFDLPVPPSTNALHRPGFAVGDRKLSHKYRTWKKVAAQQIMIDRAAWTKKALPHNQPYVAKIRINKDDGADVDNRIKALLDLLVEMQVTPDDRHLQLVSAGRSADVAPSRCIVTVRSLPLPQR